MDTGKLVEILRATMDPNQREAAEKQLEQVHKIIGFAPSLLQVVMSASVDLSVRQAGVIYLKNLVAQFWQEKEEQRVEPGKPLPFTLHEQDRAMIRDAIVDALVYAQDLVRVQLAVCVSNIVKHDFPARWTGIVDKISVYLQMNDSSVCMGALLCLYQLVKNFEYKSADERAPLNEAMHMLLPMVHQRCLQLMPDPSDVSVLLQKQILKIFFALVQYFLPLTLITRDVLAQWMELLREVVGRPIPEQQASTFDEDEQADLPWWKCKKWALHILTRIFERYGSPDNVSQDYAEFAPYYLKTYTAGILEVLLKLLDQYRQKSFVSPRILQLTLNYINEAVTHSFSWKLLKPHMLCVVQDVVFPLMCCNDRDEELWNTDPHEYIRMKFDVFEDFISPVTAAQTLLHSIAKKRKEMLQKSMEFVMTVLTNPQSTARQTDGALHMVGTVADVLLKRKIYKDQMENILVAYVFPHFQSEHGFMRARACWVLHYFCGMKFSSEQNLLSALQLTQSALLNDHELPVKVEAAVALQMLITNQERAEKHLEPHIKAIALELLSILRETENDDLTNVMQKIVCTYTQQLLPIAVEMTQHLAQTFTQVINCGGDDGGGDEKTITAMGILNTMDTILSVMEDHRDIMVHLEPIVLNVIGLILTQSIIEFYEEAMSLVYSLSSNAISGDMWKVFELMYQTFQKDGFDFFTDMMPALHNFVRVDTQAFVSNENHLLAIYNMSKAVLNSEAGEDAECHAAKLLEVVILHCKGMIDQCIPPFVELVLGRLTREVKTSELRTMCLQVVIAALFYNPHLLLETLEKIHVPNTTDSITGHFIQQWVHDTDCFLGLHDRKLCVLGLCTLLSSPPFRSRVSTEVSKKLLPALLLLFDGLKRAYAYKAQEEEDGSDEEDEEDFDPDVLGSDEDDVNEEGGPEYLERLSASIKKKSQFPVTSVHTEEDDEEEEWDEAEETALEGYSTPLDEEGEAQVDEYCTFKECMHGLKTSDPNWYNILTSNLTPEQQRAFEEVFVLAEQRRAAAESKRIEKSGGYQFANQTVPSSFNFGGSPLS